MKVINGKAIAQNLRLQLKEKIALLPTKPGLAVVIVGENPASQIYVRNKIKACEEVGINSFSYELPATASQSQLNALLDELGENKGVHGILLQLPLPNGLNAEEAARHIPVGKDVDGFSAENLGKLLQGKAKITACTPSGVMQILQAEGVCLKGKHAVVLGRSETVGKPMAMLLLNADATVTVCHSKTENLTEICKQADILISAVGIAKFVKQEMVKKDAVVIDVGINRDENGKLCGDVDFEDVCKKCSLITPVPGGVGPMTITMLMYNTYLAFVKE